MSGFLKLHLFSEIKLQISKFQQFLKMCVMHMVSILLYYAEWGASWFVFLAKCCQGHQITGDKLDGAGSVHDWEYAYRVLVGRLVGKGPLGRPGHR